MNLQTYIATFISFLNGIVVPFMLGMAFLIFVINVFRFFVVGGSNPDSQEKAKRLAIYGVGAFVFIIIFWGIVNLLTSSFGLQRFGETESRCSDYECPDGNLPSAGDTFTGDGFGNGIGDPRSPDVGGGSGFPTTPGATIPSQPTTPSMPSQPSTPSSPSMPSTPTIDAAADYSGITGDSVNSVAALFPTINNTALVDAFNAISAPGLADSVRVNNARAFTDAGFISESDFADILSNINYVRSQDNFPPISSSFAVADPNYTDALTTYNTNTQNAINIITDWNGGAGIAAQSQIDDLFDSENLTLAERMATVDTVVTSNDPLLRAELRSSIESSHQAERVLTN